MLNLGSLLEYDLNGDGVLDSNVGYSDIDGDGVIEVVTDTDHDGMCDAVMEEDPNGTTQLFLDENNDGNFDIMTELYDADGDGAADYGKLEYDADSDGMMDTSIEIGDTNGDGDFDVLSVGEDTNNDGVIDTYDVHSDTTGDGEFDTHSEINLLDLDGDGMTDAVREQVDFDGDGEFDAAVTTAQTEILGLEEISVIEADTDGDGVNEVIIQGDVDYNGDGEADFMFTATDVDGDNELDGFDIYSYDTNEAELIELDDQGYYYDDMDSFENFNPAHDGKEGVFGNPGESMEEWEFQGPTGRCAIYSQKFVIEEFTGMELDIEEMADIAEANGWFSEESGTSPMAINKLLDYYGVENEMSFDNDMSDIENCLSSGGKVIVALDSGEIWEGETDSIYSPLDGADHAVEVIGVDYSDPDNPMVILNDSGHPDGCGSMIPLDEFYDAWEDSGFQMVSCYPA